MDLSIPSHAAVFALVIDIEALLSLMLSCVAWSLGNWLGRCALAPHVSELVHLPDSQERWTTLRCAVQTLEFAENSPVPFLLAMFLVIASVIAAKLFGAAWFVWIMPALIMLCRFVWTLSMLGRARREVRKLLNQRGILICLHCGYDLRGQHLNTCSECGRTYDPTLLRKWGAP